MKINHKVEAMAQQFFPGLSHLFGDGDHTFYVRVIPVYRCKYILGDHINFRTQLLMKTTDNRTGEHNVANGTESYAENFFRRHPWQKYINKNERLKPPVSVLNNVVELI